MLIAIIVLIITLVVGGLVFPPAWIVSLIDLIIIILMLTGAL
jgi:hypothetical protein